MNDDSRLDCSDMDAATDDQLCRDNARLTTELELAQAEVLAARSYLDYLKDTERHGSPRVGLLSLYIKYQAARAAAGEGKTDD